MKAAFADTFFWIALADPNELAHADAKRLARDPNYAQIITSDEVLTEYANFYSGWPVLVRTQIVISLRRFLTMPSVRVIPQSRESFLLGIDLFSRRLDKGYSLTDCISMQIMRREGLTQVLTNDRHFEQEGFRALFRQNA